MGAEACRKLQNLSQAGSEAGLPAGWDAPLRGKTSIKTVGDFRELVSAADQNRVLMSALMKVSTTIKFFLP